MLKVLFFTTFLHLISFNSNAQVISAEIKIVDSAIKSTATGNTFVEYSGYSLLETLSQILKQPKGLIKTYPHLEDFPVYIKISASENLTSETVQKILFSTLLSTLQIKAEFKTERRMVYVAEMLEDDKLVSCKTKIEGETRKIIQINRTWDAQCVKIKSLLDQLSTWYGYLIIDKTNKKSEYNFSMNNDDWETVLKDIQFNYGITIVQKEIELPVLHLTAAK